MSRSSKPSDYVETIIERVESILHKRKQLAPFPVEPLKFYYSMFPLAAFAPVEVPGDVVRQGNLTKLFTVEAPVFHCDMGDGRIFHVITSLPVATPDGGEQFVVPADNPHLDALLAWYAKARHMDYAHAEYLQQIRRIAKMCGSEYQFSMAWPELAAYTKTPKPRLTNFSSPSVRRDAIKALNERIDPGVKDMIHTALAEGIMLPDHEDVAWVHFNTSK